MTLTFLDSGVLLTGWKGRDRLEALRVMADPQRSFVSSMIVRLELMPKPTFHKNQAEIEFYEAHFQRLKGEEPLSEPLGKEALAMANRYGLAAADALNVAAAIRQGATEFVTSELPGKPLFRVREIAVKTIFQS